MTVILFVYDLLVIKSFPWSQSIIFHHNCWIILEICLLFTCQNTSYAATAVFSINRWVKGFPVEITTSKLLLRDGGCTASKVALILLSSLLQSMIKYTNMQHQYDLLWNCQVAEISSSVEAATQLASTTEIRFCFRKISKVKFSPRIQCFLSVLTTACVILVPGPSHWYTPNWMKSIHCILVPHKFMLLLSGALRLCIKSNIWLYYLALIRFETGELISDLWLIWPRFLMTRMTNFFPHLEYK